LRIVCAGVLLAGSVQAARPLTGTVRDARTLLPIPYAVVSLTETGRSTEADIDGRFRFETLPDGEYHLCARRIGYRPKCGIAVRIGPEEFSAPQVLLVPSPLRSSGIVVRGGKLREQPLAAGGQTVITADDIRTTGATTAADAIERAGGIEVVRSGSGTARVSVRGSRPDAVLVLVDGVPLNSAGQAADLASIPAASIEQIRVVQGPAAAAAGADALAGAVLIVTKAAASRVRTEIGGAYGSFESRQGGVQIDGIGYGGQRLRLSWQDELTAGNFGYFDPQLGIDTLRANNSLHRQTFGARADGDIGRGWLWRGGVSYYRVHAGIPGAVYQLTPLASRREKRYVYSARLDREDRRGVLGLSYARTTDWNYYLNTGILPYESELNSTVDLWRACYDLHAGALRGAGVAVEYAAEAIDGIDHRIPAYSFGTARRDNYAATARFERKLALRWPGTHALHLGAAYRYDQSETEADYPQTPISPLVDPPQKVWRFWSPNLSVGIDGTFGEVDWSASAGYGKSFRRAPLLDMFWDESYRTRGNPGLRPERAEQTELGYSLVSPRGVKFTFDQRFFWSRYDDLIFWRPGQGGSWNPANIGRARIDGREEELTVSAWGERLQAKLAHQYQNHRNTAGEPNTDGQPLPFRYRHKITAAVRGDWEWLHAGIAWRAYDRRYLREAGTASKSLDPYNVTDLDIGLRHRHQGVSGEIRFRVDNITDARYELVEREPMPGRSYHVQLKLEL